MLCSLWPFRHREFSRSHFEELELVTIGSGALSKLVLCYRLSYSYFMAIFV